MQDNPVHNFDELKYRERLAALQKGVTRLEAVRDTLLSRLTDTKAKIVTEGERVELLTKGGELLRQLMDLLVLDQVRNIESLVTEGLKAIFDDQDLAFKAEVGQYRNKISIDLMVQAMQDGIEVEGPPLESFGGGVSSIVSLILRLMTLMKLGKFPLLVLDETLSAVSEDYVDATGLLLAKLAESSGTPILLVTHKHAFLDHAKRAYQGLESPTKTIALRQIR